MPDGQQVTAALASRLAQHLHADDPHAITEFTQLGPQALSDLFIHHFGRPHFFQAVNEVLHADRRADELRLDLHEMILEIPFALIASTTWDDLFERAGRQLTPPVFLNAITNDEELLSLYTPHGPLLIQPRGSLRKENALVEGLVHHSHERNHPGLCAFLRALFFSHRILFIGFGDRDTGLLDYYRLLETHLGEQTAGVWSRSYVFAPTMAPGAVERLQQMGLRILDCFVPQTAAAVRKDMLYERVALESFLKVLRRETQLVVNRVERSRRIADFLRETQCLGRELRARAGLSPIGLPDRRQLDDHDCSKVPHYLSLSAEYNEQQRMKERFLYVIERAVANGCEVRLILSTEFDAIQDRATNKKWVWMQLRNLVEFFNRGTGMCGKVKVVDRQGPFEMQQYILGEGELAESVKLDVHDPTYYHARISKDPREAQAAARLFDVCFTGLASRNLENLMSQSRDPGRDYLIATVCEALSARRPEAILQADASLDPRGTQLAEELRAAATPDTQHSGLLRDNVEILLTTSPPHVVQGILAEELIYQAIKEHLLAQWTHEMDVLAETRPAWMIQLTSSCGEPKGELDKDVCHRMLYDHEESELYNLHLAAFVLTSDARRLILRQRRSDGPPFDPGLWDRTFTGHVKKDSTFLRELENEVLHHFEACGVCRSSVLTRTQFLEYCRQRTKPSSADQSLEIDSQREMELVALQLQREPVAGVYERVRTTDGKLIKESARSMLYLGLMPGTELPRQDPSGKHFADWVEVPLADIGRMLTTGSAMRYPTVISGEMAEVGPATLTREAWALLKLCHGDILSQL